MPSAVICSPDISTRIAESFAERNFEVLRIPKCGDVASPISGHPDIQVFAHEDHLFCHKHICGKFVKKAERFYNIIITERILSPQYPGDVSFNVKTAGRFFFHKKGCTAAEITAFLEKKNFEPVHVSQGYCGCSILNSGAEALITADRGIHLKALANGIDSLLITPGGINLPGYKYGFIGGCSGFSGNRVYISGKISHHPDFGVITEFLNKNRVDLIYLTDEIITDYGSFIIREY